MRCVHVPKWNPINVCSYHLQEAGATPVEEVAYTLATAIGVLDAVRESGQVSDDEFPEVVGRISFFVNAGIRFVEEMCKLRAFGRLWDRIVRRALRRHRRTAAAVPLRRAGQLARPHRGPAREQRAAHRARSARRDAVEGRSRRAVQLPTWNEALGLPRPWDQQWSLRIQQVLAYETDLLEYDDLFAGSHVVEAKTTELAEAADAELAWVLAGGGAFSMIDAMKHRLVQSHAERVRRIESGEIAVIGVNRFTETADSPLVAALDGESAILVVDEAAEKEQLETLEAWRVARDADAVARALDELRAVGDHRRQPDARHHRLRPRRRHRRRVGGRVARRVRRVPRAHRRRGCTRTDQRRHGEGPRAGQGTRAASSVIRSASSSANPGSMVTPTARSRSRSRHATRAWK